LVCKPGQGYPSDGKAGSWFTLAILHVEAGQEESKHQSAQDTQLVNRRKNLREA